MITKFYLTKDLYNNYKLPEKDVLTGLSKINLFIGQNNTGKSRFLRQIFKDEALRFTLNNVDNTSISAFLQYAVDRLSNHLLNLHIEDVDDILGQFDQYKAEVKGFEIKRPMHLLIRLKEFAEQLKNYKGKQKIRMVAGYSYMGRHDLTNFSQSVVEIGYELDQKIDKSFPEEFDIQLQYIYIPILRGLRPVQHHGDKFDELDDCYKTRTLVDYFDNEKETFESKIFTGLSLYADTRKLLLGEKGGRERIKNFENFLSKNFFNNETVTLIPRHEKDVLFIGIGNEEREVYNLGDGIQSIIILLYPLFFNQDSDLLVFIEEPENSLHPGLQRIFLETLMRPEFSRFQFFITTHSNHFLDISMDIDAISIYSFERKSNGENEPTYKIENTSNADIKTLDLIGVRNASVFLSNCTIWVEGITDRLYIKKILEVYQNNVVGENSKKIYKEDSHFAFIEYGGANLKHWSFDNTSNWEKIRSLSVNTKIFIVADRDDTDKKPTSEKAKRLADLKKILKDNIYIFDAREIENILSPDVLIATVLASESANSEKIVFDEKAITIAKYKNAKLGEFIDKSFKNLKKKYSAPSGTVANKLEFCKKAISRINNREDLSVEAMKMAEQLYNFIKRSN